MDHKLNVTNGHHGPIVFHMSSRNPKTGVRAFRVTRVEPTEQAWAELDEIVRQHETRGNS